MIYLHRTDYVLSEDDENSELQDSLNQSTCAKVPVVGICVECSTRHGARRTIWMGVEERACSENQIAAGGDVWGDIDSGTEK